MRDDIEKLRNDRGELPIIEVRHLSFSYGADRVLDDVSFSIERGKVTTILGSNGSGKSTLLDLMTKNLEPDSGKVFLKGRNISGVKLKDFAKEVSIVHQNNTASPDITVEALVEMGRAPYIKRMTAPSDEDQRMVEWALEVTHTAEFRSREISSLSGGQRQRAWIAMALAQGTDVLLLDEPTTYLDVRYQLEILNLTRALNREHGITVVMVLHDVNQAICYSDTIVGLKDGRVILNGPPDEVVTQENVRRLFDVDLPVVELRGKKYVLLDDEGTKSAADVTQ